MERAVEVGYVEVRLEAVDLPAVPVALDRDIERSEAQLVIASVEHLRGKKEKAGARPEAGEAIADEAFDIVKYPGRHQHPEHRRAPAPGHDQRVDAAGAR